MIEDQGTDSLFVVALNGEEQYSIWFVDRPLPLGWQEAGFRETKGDCLDYTRSIWTQVRAESFSDRLSA